MDDFSRFFVCDNAREELCLEVKPDPCGVVIFGASGDLTHRKLLPALFEQFQRRLLPETFFILGCARSDLDDQLFRDSFRQYLLSREVNAGAAEDFLNHIYYLSGSYEDNALYKRLSVRLTELSEREWTAGNCLYYLATPPSLYTTIVSGLGVAGLTSQESGCWSRVVVEKPFGHDLASSRKLDSALHQWLAEEQIYRIDHYLGKETVQNIFILRFANAIFEPIWNRRYIDHVQISVAETLGVENRAGYYEQAGALRDMFQNHMLEMLSLVAMEPPAMFEADRHRDEKVKLLRSIRPFSGNGLGDWLVRGQYAPGSAQGQSLPGYRQEKGVNADSQTETYVAMKVMVDNWRWQGVPFYLRSGKRLAKQVSEIAITFKSVPHSMFGKIAPERLQPNVLTLKIQPEEGIALTMEAKRPGPRMCMNSLTLNFSYRDAFGERSSNAYERLLLDCMVGDQTLFVRHDGAELAWIVLEPVLNNWQTSVDDCPLEFYEAGGDGPQGANRLLTNDGRRWRPL